MPIDALGRVAGFAAHRVLSLPNAMWLPLSGRRRVIDGQRMTPRLEVFATAGRHALQALSDPPTKGQRRRAELGGRLAAWAHLGDAQWRDVMISDQDGHRQTARLYEPAAVSEPSALVVYVHGGGWQIGSIAGYDGLCAFLARTAHLKVLSLSYRLATEHTFPAAYDDVMAGFRYALDHADELGVARDRVAIAGDSAGGNLASAAALQLGTDPKYRPKLAVLLYPVVDADLDRYESAHLFQAPLNREIVHRDMRRYAPNDDDRLDPRFAVMAAADVSPMPPTVIATAGVDVLRDQGEAFGERLRRSEVDVVVQRFDGLPHGFANMLVDPDARRATQSLAAVIQQRMEM